MEVAEAGQDELVIADALNAAGYTDLTGAIPLSKLPAELPNRIWKEIASEVVGGEKHLKEFAEPLKAWLQATTSAFESFYVVYFSPFATTEGPEGVFSIGRYTDMYGDLLDLDERAYFAYALAVGAAKNGETQAEDVLSDRSAKFPTNVPVPPLPAVSS